MEDFGKKEEQQDQDMEKKGELNAEMYGWGVVEKEKKDYFKCFVGSAKQLRNKTIT